MTNEEFESSMRSVIDYYGRQNISPVVLEVLWLEFRKLEVERFKKICYLVMRDCTYPPRLAEFVIGAKKLLEWEIANPPQKPTPLPDPNGVFFPDEAWIDRENEKLKLENPHWTPEHLAHIKATMLAMVKAMKRNYKATAGWVK